MDGKVEREMNHVEVFRTSVETRTEADRMAALLSKEFPGARINFDLDDCDRILRIETKEGIPPDVVIALLRDARCAIEVLN